MKNDIQKIVITVFVFLFLFETNNLAAQDRSSSFGLRAGSNVAWITNRLDGINPRTTFNVSAFYSKRITGQLYIQPELSVNGKGGDETFVSFPDGEEFRVTFKLTYIDIPLLLKYTFSPDNVSVSLLAGAMGGINIGSTLDTNEGVSIDISDEVGDLNGAAITGIEVGVPFVNHRLLFSARYEIGFRGPFSSSNSELNAISVTAGMAF